jgi:hypothetical protein
LERSKVLPIDRPRPCHGSLGNVPWHRYMFSDFSARECVRLKPKPVRIERIPEYALDHAGGVTALRLKATKAPHNSVFTGLRLPKQR